MTPTNPPFTCAERFGCRPPSAMTWEERLFLSKWGRFTKYGVLPLKQIVHLLLLVVTTLQLLSWYPDQQGSKSVERSLQDFFCTGALGIEECAKLDYEGFEPTAVLSSGAEFLSNLDRAVDFYWSEEAEGVARNIIYSKMSGANSTLPRLTMVWTSLKDTVHASSIQEKEYTPGFVDQTYELGSSASTGKLGPFDVAVHGESRVRDAVLATVRVELQVNFTMFQYTELTRDCMSFQIKQSYDFSQGGVGAGTLHVQHLGNCDAMTADWAGQHFWTSGAMYHIFIMVVCVYRILEFIRRKWGQMRLLRMIEKRVMARNGGHLFAPIDSHVAPAEYTLLTWREKLGVLLSKSSSVQVIGDICLIAGNIDSIVQQRHIPGDGTLTRWFYAIGQTIVWFSVMSFVSHFRQFEFMNRVFSEALPGAFWYILGTVPVLVGFVAFGTICFAFYSRRFESFYSTAITLFCTMNGDEMLVTFEDIRRAGGFAGTMAVLYIVLFCIVYIYVFLNVFLVIIAFVYEQAQEEDSKEENAELWHGVDLETIRTGHGGTLSKLWYLTQAMDAANPRESK